MKSEKELWEFYKRELLKDLQGLEDQRKGIVNKLTIMIAVMLCLVFVSVLFLSANFGFNPAFIIAPVIICGIIAAGLYKFITSGYRVDFKYMVIERIVRFIDEALVYNSSFYIPETIYKMSEIFKMDPDRYRGDDLVKGKVGKTEVEFSEIHSEYKTRDKNGTHWHTIFKGLFFIGDFNKHFTCRMVVLPDKAERMFGHIGKMLQSWNIARADLIKLEDVEFEKFFVVYGSDQIQARYILSPGLMQRITEFRRKTGRDIYLSFQLSKVFVAIPYRKDLFEPKMFRSVLDFEPIKEYYEDLQLVLGIVEDLDLDTRIWTKE
ncbi:MAG: DUF3137 domain-containing protein [Planctomycetota bacterium]|jgi:hypothetical protein